MAQTSLRKEFMVRCKLEKTLSYKLFKNSLILTLVAFILFCMILIFSKIFILKLNFLLYTFSTICVIGVLTLIISIIVFEKEFKEYIKLSMEEEDKIRNYEYFK